MRRRSGRDHFHEMSFVDDEHGPRRSDFSVEPFIHASPIGVFNATTTRGAHLFLHPGLQQIGALPENNDFHIPSGLHVPTGGPTCTQVFCSKGTSLIETTRNQPIVSRNFPPIPQIIIQTLLALLLRHLVIPAHDPSPYSPRKSSGRCCRCSIEIQRHTQYPRHCSDGGRRLT
jgi:hypothetical protein